MTHWPYHQLRIVTGCLHPTPEDNLQFLQSPNMLSFIGKEPHCHYHTVLWQLDICSTKHSFVHQVGMHAVSYCHTTHLYLPHNNSSVQLTITTEVWHSGQITDGMRNGWTTPQDGVLSSSTQAPTLLKAAKNSVGPAQQLLHQCQMFPLLLAQMGNGPLCSLWVWQKRTNRRPCCPLMFNPTTSPSTAWHEVMDDETIECLPWDLVQPSSG